MPIIFKSDRTRAITKGYEYPPTPQQLLAKEFLLVPERINFE